MACHSGSSIFSGYVLFELILKGKTMPEIPSDSFHLENDCITIFRYVNGVTFYCQRILERLDLQPSGDFSFFFSTSSFPLNKSGGSTELHGSQIAYHDHIFQYFHIFPYISHVFCQCGSSLQGHSAALRPSCSSTRPRPMQWLNLS